MAAFCRYSKNGFRPSSVASSRSYSPDHNYFIMIWVVTAHHPRYPPTETGQAFCTNLENRTSSRVTPLEVVCKYASVVCLFPSAKAEPTSPSLALLPASVSSGCNGDARHKHQPPIATAPVSLLACHYLSTSETTPPSSSLQTPSCQSSGPGCRTGCGTPASRTQRHPAAAGPGSC